MKEKRM